MVPLEPSTSPLNTILLPGRTCCTNERVVACIGVNSLLYRITKAPPGAHMVPPDMLVTSMMSGFQSLQRCMSVNTSQTSCEVALISIADETRIGTDEHARSNEISVRKRETLRFSRALTFDKQHRNRWIMLGCTCKITTEGALVTKTHSDAGVGEAQLEKLFTFQPQK